VEQVPQAYVMCLLGGFVAVPGSPETHARHPLVGVGVASIVAPVEGRL
jgi:hypothetical protein